ncbi:MULTISPECIES: saccharopine dehydrogenase NADP-binding domain-containing protein [Streptomyces]|uniref:Saccharopine dehydrogenase NADP-binding domain-containing protein n=1 Tax=Streptomyces spinosisporus TaxID=2927582 RepID=A0ABS9XGJ8_9ACTN|nr:MULTISPECIES: saccharopine dehydrogenase NADP-binding domain-containing protein [Streptomyces]MCI3240027.1 saccharopine dehydrogenase NADP-binding domain-containing protein [Streptomyces spinosisporus]WUB38689.1 saccharopine dehydrogenase NADP-binding domain-containing protein [Streptomyces sp. NBC_00588]
MTPDTPTGEIWILGAAGRIGSAVAARLAAQGFTPVLVGRGKEALSRTAVNLGPGAGAKVVVTGSVDDIAAEVARQRPAVVVNTIGNFAETAPPIARACLRGGGHYVDMAADLVALPRLLSLHDEASAAGSTLVTGAGFGVLATEAVVAKLCENRPTPERVRVDALGSVATDAGTVGAAFAASIVNVIATGGRAYEEGRLVTRRLGADPQDLTLPDGETVKSAGAPSGELMAAQRASGAPSVTVTTALAPTSAVARAVLPLAGKLLSIPRLQRFAVRRMAGVRTKAAPRPRRHSWGHAVVIWSDGTRREGWLRADDGMDYTAAVAAETAAALARGEGKPGAYTPAAVLGPDLAVAAGGTFVLD